MDRSHINARWAFDHYQTISHWLPSAKFPEIGHYVSSLADLAGDFDVFLLDAFGVLNVGQTAIASAPARVAELQAAGKRVMVLTNGASFPATEAQGKFRQLGFEFALDNIVASRDALSYGLTQSSEATLWGVMARPSSQLETLPAQCILLAEEVGVFNKVEGFILLGSSTWSAIQQKLLSQSLQKNPRPVWVVNPDLVAPRETDFSLEPGYFAHQLSDIKGVTLRFFGKPFNNIYDLAFSRLGGVPKHRVLMVGDTLHTDVLGGAAYGIKTALVTGHGLFAGHNVASFIDESGIKPDYIMASP